MRRALYLLLIVTCSLIVHAEPSIAPKADTAHKAASAKAKLKPKIPAVLKLDSSAVNTRHIDSAAVDDYARQPEFVYNETYKGPSMWTRFWHWLWQWLQPDETIQRSTWQWIGIVLRYVLIAGGVAALVFAILKLSGIDILNTFRKSSQPVLAFSEAEENIHEIDFEAEIEKAVTVGNYRYAVRLLYLRTLKVLTDKQLITWQPNKTNAHYIAELSDPGRRDVFRRLTMQFEYVWYGDFAVNAEVFRQIRPLFYEFNDKAA